jgi:hypothetical protein
MRRAVDDARVKSEQARLALEHHVAGLPLIVSCSGKDCVRSYPG